LVNNQPVQEAFAPTLENSYFLIGIYTSDHRFIANISANMQKRKDQKVSAQNFERIPQTFRSKVFAQSGLENQKTAQIRTSSATTVE
jgi:hypothetical protein